MLCVKIISALVEEEMEAVSVESAEEDKFGWYSEFCLDQIFASGETEVFP